MLNGAFNFIFTLERLDEILTFNQLNFPVIDSIVFSHVDIFKITDSFKFPSSFGVDEINSKVLKNTRVNTSVILRLIFSKPLTTGAVSEN